MSLYSSIFKDWYKRNTEFELPTKEELKQLELSAITAEEKKKQKEIEEQIKSISKQLRSAASSKHRHLIISHKEACKEVLQILIERGFEVKPHTNTRQYIIHW